MKIIGALALLVVLAVVTGFTVDVTSQANQNLESVRALAAQRTQLASLTSRLEARSRAAKSALANLEEKEARAAVGAQDGSANGPSSESPAQPRPPMRRPSQDAINAIIGRDPKKSGEWVRALRESFDLQNASIVEALGLSAEQIAKLQARAAGMQERTMDVMGALAIQGLDPDGNEAKALRRQLQPGASWSEILGEKYPLWLEYMGRRLIVSAIVDDLAGFAIYSGDPVTSAQVEQAAQVLAANSTGRVPDTRFAGLGVAVVDPATINWAAARSQLGGILSPTQIATLGDGIEYSQKQREANAREAQLTAEFKRRRGGR